MSVPYEYSEHSTGTLGAGPPEPEISGIVTSLRVQITTDSGRKVDITLDGDKGLQVAIHLGHTTGTLYITDADILRMHAIVAGMYERWAELHGTAKAT